MNAQPFVERRVMMQRLARQRAVGHDNDTDNDAPRLPHERDESAGVTGGEPSEPMRQGKRDLDRGLQDTSRAPEADRAYRKLKKQGGS